LDQELAGARKVLPKWHRPAFRARRRNLAQKGCGRLVGDAAPLRRLTVRNILQDLLVLMDVSRNAIRQRLLLPFFTNV
jgi:hypothetical protein